MLRDHFYLGNNHIEWFKSYRYLGIIFSNSGSFNMAISDLKIKATKASFKLRKIIDTNHLSPKVAMSLFNSLIKPIILYGAEIWGVTFCAPTLQKMLKKFNDSPIEKVHLSFARYTLGVHKHTASVAVYGELGILPMAVAALQCAHKYKVHICGKSADSLLGLATVECQTTEKNAWWEIISKQKQPLINCSQMSPQEAKKKYWDIFTDNWKLKINDCASSKLRTYAQMKFNLQYEIYLSDVKIGPTAWH